MLKLSRRGGLVMKVKKKKAKEKKKNGKEEEKKKEEDIHDSEPSEDDDQDIEYETWKKSNPEAEEDEEELAAFHLLNKSGKLKGPIMPMFKSSSTVLQKKVSENEDESDIHYSDLSDTDEGLQHDEDICFFTRHMTHVLSEKERLSKGEWTRKWDVPAFGSSSSKWIGTGDCLIEKAEPSMNYGLKQKLYEHWLHNYEASGGKDFHSSKQREFFSLCSSYKDILHHDKKAFYLEGLEEDSSMMDAYIMHTLNHVFQSQDVAMKNEAIFAKNKIFFYSDRGFCRPKVLILLPLASIALRVVKRLIELTPPGNKVCVQHMDRFMNEFGVANNENVPLPNAAESENTMLQKDTKPSDFKALFGDNNNDNFVVGIKFTGKSIKLCSGFYTSDLIVASPLGLTIKIDEIEAYKYEDRKDVDYLSSIEIVVIDHADVICMQNWSHVTTVLQHMNQLFEPFNEHMFDYMQIRQWYLDGHAQFYRQTIILSSYLTPEIMALFNHKCVNYEGKLKFSCKHEDILPQVVVQADQIYERFCVDSVSSADDDRLGYFKKTVFPRIMDRMQAGVMIFISSYFEFLQVKRFLKSENSSIFLTLTAYTEQHDATTTLHHFHTGKCKILLYTEGAHFFHRYKIPGISNLIFYSLPQRKEFYPELVNMLQGSNSIYVLFSRFDQFPLQRIVGSNQAKRLLISKDDFLVIRQEADKA